MRGDEFISGVPSGFFRVAAFLILSGQVSVSRQRLSTLFWPDHDNPAANFRQVIARIKHFQERNGFKLISSNFSNVYLSLESNVECDLSKLLEILTNGDTADAGWACALYKGDVLADIASSGSEYEEWLSGQSDALRSRFLDFVLQAIAPDSSISERERHACAHGLLKIDPCSEPAYSLLMTDAGNRGDLSRLHALYQSYKDHLANELGVAPSGAISNLYDQLTRKLSFSQPS